MTPDLNRLDKASSGPRSAKKKGQQMNMNTGRQIVLAARPRSKPQLFGFRLEEAQVPAPGSSQVQLGALDVPKTDFPGAQKREYLLDRETERSHPMFVPGAVSSRLECREFQTCGLFESL
jgi:hypothetical protein